MKKTIRAISILLCVLLFTACTPAAAPEETQEQQRASVMEEESEPIVQSLSVSQTLLGFIVPDDGTIEIHTLMHGFLRTAENLGYPAKIYTATVGDASVTAVDDAINDGCKGLLIYNPDESNSAAVEKATSLGIPVVSPYYASQGADASIVTDLAGYSEEIARGIAERMVERECKAGRILVYGRNPVPMYEAFKTAVATYYPQFEVDMFTKTAATDEAAVDELANYILWNRDVKGLFCTDTGDTVLAVHAREQAQDEFKEFGAPEAVGGADGEESSDDEEENDESETDESETDDEEANDELETPTPTPDPNATPGPSPSALISPTKTPVPEGLISSILISIAGLGMSDDNVALMLENDIYAFVLEPFYEASAQSFMALDRILRGQDVPENTRVHMPIVRQDSLEKFKLIHDEVTEWFGHESAVS